MNRDKELFEKKRKFDIATSDVWKQLRAEWLNSIVRESVYTLDVDAPIKMVGELARINDIDKWAKDYETFIEKQKQKG